MRNELIGLKRNLHVEISAEHGVFLFSERGVTVLRGSGIEPLITLLDGTRTMADLLRSMPHGIDPGQTSALVERLRAAGLVTTLPGFEAETDERALAYWDACGVSTPRRGMVPEVEVVSLAASVDRRLVATALNDAGMAVRTPITASTRPELAIVVCDDYLDPRLAELDRGYREARVPWLLAKPTGTQVWVGPFFQDGHGCWQCLAHRLWHHRQAEACAQRLLGKDGPASRPAVSVPALLATGVNLVALEAAKWLQGLRTSQQHCVWTLDTMALHGRHHELTRRPQCPGCGDPRITPGSEPVILAATPKSSARGGYRSLSPEDMLARYQHLVSPVTGLIKEITKDEGGSARFNSYRSGANVAVTGAQDMAAFRRTLRDQSGGKGATPIEAEVGALCEAIERYSATFHGDESRTRGSFRSLADKAIHPQDVLLVDPRQQADRERWNAQHGPFQTVGESFDEDEELDWTPVWSLTDRKSRLLPTAMLYFGAPAEIGGRGLSADSNGSAAGGTVTDAVLQGLLELVERDAVALWWYNRTSAPAVDLDSFEEPWLRGMREEYHALGRQLWVLDVTSDLGIPVFVALSRKVSGGPERITFGFGAHLDPAIALRRAVTEMNQLSSAVIDGDLRLTDPDAQRWFAEASVAEEGYLAADVLQPPRTRADYHCPAHEDIRQDVELVTRRLARQGLEAFALDQTRPDIGLPVVKVIVPGLRHFWARFGPGRLFEVPVALGRLSHPTPYEALNPIPLFV